MDIPPHCSAIFSKEGNFCDILFGSSENKSPWEKGLLLKERMCFL